MYPGWLCHPVLFDTKLDAAPLPSQDSAGGLAVELAVGVTLAVPVAAKRWPLGHIEGSCAAFDQVGVDQRGHCSSPSSAAMVAQYVSRWS